MSLWWLLPAAVLLVGGFVIVRLAVEVAHEARTLTHEIDSLGSGSATLERLQTDARTAVASLGDLSSLTARPFGLFRPRRRGGAPST